MGGAVPGALGSRLDVDRDPDVLRRPELRKRLFPDPIPGNHRRPGRGRFIHCGPVLHDAQHGNLGADCPHLQRAELSGDWRCRVHAGQHFAGLPGPVELRNWHLLRARGVAPDPLRGGQPQDSAHGGPGQPRIGRPSLPSPGPCLWVDAPVVPGIG